MPVMASSESRRIRLTIVRRPPHLANPPEIWETLTESNEGAEDVRSDDQSLARRRQRELAGSVLV